MNNFSIITAIRFLRRSRRFAGIAFLFFALSTFSIFAQNTNPAPSNRWLLIVDTSRAMQPRAEATLQLATGLVLSGMDRQILPGDTLGVWTYNDRLYAGNFPVKQLTPESLKPVARELAAFLRRQKYENNSDLGAVIPAMMRVVKDSKFITVIFISDGSTQMRGTPFDDKINASYKAWQTEQKKSDMPFVTLLRAEDGRFTEFAVNTPPFPLEMPPLPEPLLHPKKPEAKPAPKPVEKTLPPLIISGKKPAPEKTETNSEPTALEKPAAPKKPVEEKTEPVSEPVIVPKTVVTNSENGPTKTTESTNIAEQKPEVAETKIASTPKKTNAAPPNAGLESNSVALENSTAENQKTNAPVETAEAVPPQPRATHEAFWILVFATSGIFALIGVMLIRRSRRTRHASLITRSLDRDKK